MVLLCNYICTECPILTRHRLNLVADADPDANPDPDPDPDPTPTRPRSRYPCHHHPRPCGGSLLGTFGSLADADIHTDIVANDACNVVAADGLLISRVSCCTVILADIEITTQASVVANPDADAATVPGNAVSRRCALSVANELQPRPRP